MPPHNVLARAVIIAALVMPIVLHAQPDGPEHAAADCPPAEPRAQQLAGRATELAVVSPSDGLAIAVLGPSVDMPWIVSPVVRGSGGVYALFTVCDRPGFLLRVGAGVANIEFNRVAPPFQEGPRRRWTLDGSELAWRLEGGEFYGAMQRRNWGPGWTGSLILDGAAPPLVSLGWRRPAMQPSTNPWLAWMGPWMADVFVGQLWGHDVPVRPFLIGMRLQLQPFDFLQLGLSRTLQWGGHGRDQSIGSMVRGLLGWDNAGTRGVTAENQPGNQLGGFDWRLGLGADPGDAFYGQLVGEDENGYLPSAYIVQAGLQTHRWVQGVDLIGFIEYNDLIAGHAYGTDRPPGITYTHSVYKRGYTHDRMPLGYPAGGDITLASVGVLAQTSLVHMAMVLSWGNALPTAQRFAPGPISGANGSLQLNIDTRQQVGAGLWWWRDTAQRQRALQLWWRGLW